MDLDSIAIRVGKTVQLSASVLPEQATDKELVWTSSNTKIVIVDETGKVQAMAVGSAEIVVASKSDNVSDTCKVSVTEGIPGSHRGVIKDVHYGGSGSGGDTRNGYRYVFGSHTIQVTEEIQEYFSDISTDSFSLPGDDKGESTIGEGDILVFPVSDSFDGGFAGKVETITTLDDGKTYQYEMAPVALDEIFEELNLKQTEMDLSPYIKSIEDEEGREISYDYEASTSFDEPHSAAGRGVFIPVPELFYGADELSINIGDLSLIPRARVWFNLTLDVEIKGFSLKKAYIRADTEAHLALKSEFAQKANLLDFKSPRLSIPCFAIPIGPIIITPELSVQLEATLTGELSTSLELSSQNLFYAEVLYDGENFTYDGGRVLYGDYLFSDGGAGVKLGGKLSAGPNIGLGASIYAGALGLGVDIKPHYNLSFEGEYVYREDTISEMANVGGWLSRACFEHFFSLEFGGYLKLAWKWEKPFRIPDDFLGLKYSWGKTYLIPTLAGPLQISADSDHRSVTVETKVKNKAFIDDTMYVRILKGDSRDGDEVARAPLSFLQGKAPEKEGDEVACKAQIDGLDAGQTYYVDGPYISVMGRDVAMTPIQEANRVVTLGEVKYDGYIDIALTGDAGIIAIDMDEVQEWAGKEWFSGPGFELIGFKFDQESVSVQDCSYVQDSYFSPEPGKLFLTTKHEDDAVAHVYIIYKGLLEEVSHFPVCSGFGTIDVTFPSLVKRIGQSAFKYEWTGVNWINGKRLRGFYEDCDIRFHLPEGLEEIGDCAFSTVPLTQIDLPESLKRIGDQAFIQTHIKSFYLPESLEYVGSYALGSLKLESIQLACNGATFDDRWISSEYYPEYSSTLKTADFTGDWKKIPNSIFFGIASLSSVSIPEGVTEIGELAFMNTGIEQIDLPVSLEIICANAFSGSPLKSVYLPPNIKFFKDAFKDCGQLESVVLACNQPSTPCSMQYLPALKYVRFDSEWKSLPDAMFSGCAQLSDVFLPGCLKTIGIGAFYGCKALTEISLPEGLASIGLGAFKNTSLSAVSFPESLNQIGDQAFYDTQITTVDIPYNVAELGVNAFSSTTDAYLHPARPPKNFAWAFPKTTVIHVPAAYEIDYLIEGHNQYEIVTF